MKKSLLFKIFIFVLFILLIVGSISFINIFDDDDPEEDPNFFRDLRISAWSGLIGDDKGIISVKTKLEKMYLGKGLGDKVDLINKGFSEGNWHFEFAQLAEKSLKQKKYFAAAGYYSIASFPHLFQDRRANEMYQLALDAFQKGLKDGKYPYKLVRVTVDGIAVDAYLVYPQSYKKHVTVPVIINTGGIDGLMLFFFADYLKYWNKQGFAWVGFDMHGHGTSKNLRATSKNADAIHVAVIKALRADDSIDDKNIFIYSRSWGGYAALRLLATGKADELDVAGICAVCPIGKSVFGNIALSWILMPDQTRNIWASRIGECPGNWVKAIKASKGFNIADDSFWGNRNSDIPLLVYNTDDDGMNPVEEIKEMASLSVKGKYIITEDEKGHCPCRKSALKNVACFVETHMR